MERLTYKDGFGKWAFLLNGAKVTGKIADRLAFYENLHVQFNLNNHEKEYLRILTHYGIDPQEGMTIEECAELIAALRHKARGRAEEDEVIEELADVIIMTQQLRIAYGANKVDNMIAAKLDRQIKRINEQAV